MKEILYSLILCSVVIFISCTSEIELSEMEKSKIKEVEEFCKCDVSASKESYEIDEYNNSTYLYYIVLHYKSMERFREFAKSDSIALLNDLICKKIFNASGKEIIGVEIGFVRDTVYGRTSRIDTSLGFLYYVGPNLKEVKKKWE